MYCLIQCLIDTETKFILFSSFFSSLTVKESEAQTGCDFLKYIETETPESKLSAFCLDSFHTPHLSGSLSSHQRQPPLKHDLLNSTLRIGIWSAVSLLRNAVGFGQTASKTLFPVSSPSWFGLTICYRQGS